MVRPTAVFGVIAPSVVGVKNYRSGGTAPKLCRESFCDLFPLLFFF